MSNKKDEKNAKLVLMQLESAHRQIQSKKNQYIRIEKGPKSVNYTSQIKKNKSNSTRVQGKINEVKRRNEQNDEDKWHQI